MGKAGGQAKARHNAEAAARARWDKQKNWDKHLDKIYQKKKGK